MRIACPFCGPRELDEFTFHKTVSARHAGEFAEVYERVERIDSSVEHWQHVRACRTWLVLRRNPSTGQVMEVRSLGERAT